MLILAVAVLACGAWAMRERPVSRTVEIEGIVRSVKLVSETPPAPTDAVYHLQLANRSEVYGIMPSAQFRCAEGQRARVAGQLKTAPKFPAMLVSSRLIWCRSK